MITSPARSRIGTRIGVAFVGLAIVAGTLGLLVPTTQAAPVASPTAAATGLGDLAQCVAANRDLKVLFLVDESGSLRDTDPQNKRVDAIKAALSGLGFLQLGSDGGPDGPVQIDVSVAGFSVGYDEVIGWQSLVNGDVSSLQQQSEVFADRNTGLDTDYLAALQGAQRSIAAHASQTGSSDASKSCTAIFWFTDGEYDIENRNASTLNQYGHTKDYAPDINLSDPDSATRLEDRGRQLLCEPLGILDQIRSSGLHVIVFSLSGAISSDNRQFLQAIAESRGDSTACGTAPMPAGSALGQYLPAGSLGDLTGLFFDATNKLRNGTPGGSGNVPVCPTTTCLQGTTSFQVDPGLRSFNLLALTGAPGIAIDLLSPEQPVPLRIEADQSGQGAIGSAHAQWSWLAPDTAVIEVTLPSTDGPWNGKWSITFIDTSGTHPDAFAQSKVYVFGDVVPVLKGSPWFRRGDTAGFDAAVETRAGTPTDINSFSGLKMTGTITDPTTGAVTTATLSPPTAGGLVHGTWAVPLDLKTSVVALTLTVEPVTASGLKLAPASRKYEIAIHPPASYPRPVTATLQLSDAIGANPATGVVEVAGGDTGNGCVWVDGGRFDVHPKAITDVTLRASKGGGDSSGCVSLAPGETKQIAVEASPTGRADGVVKGVTILKLKGDDQQDTLTAEIPTSFKVVRPINGQKRLNVFLLFLALGIAGPLLLLVGLGRVIGRFGPPGDLWVAWIPVEVTKTGITDVGGGELVIPPEPWKKFSGVTHSKRRFEVDGITFESRTRVLQSPIGDASKPGSVLVSDWQNGGTRNDGRLAPVPMRLGGIWLVVVPDSDLVATTAFVAPAVTPAPLHSGPTLPTQSDDSDAPPIGPISAMLLALSETSQIEGHRDAINRAIHSRGHIVAAALLEVRAARLLDGGTSSESADTSDAQLPPTSFGSAPQVPGTGSHPGSTDSTQRPPSSF